MANLAKGGTKVHEKLVYGKKCDQINESTGMAENYINEHHKSTKNEGQGSFHPREDHALNIHLFV